MVLWILKWTGKGNSTGTRLKLFQNTFPDVSMGHLVSGPFLAIPLPFLLLLASSTVEAGVGTG